MQLYRFASTILVVSSLLGTSAFAKDAKVKECSLKSTSPSTCAKDEYCLKAKPHSYCTKKLDGGQVCSKDSACRSSICFIAKKTSPKAGKRICADVPTSGFAVGARCTLSEQCKDHFCDKGYCSTPAPAGGKCPKEVGCAQVGQGAHCLNNPATFVIYDSAGKKQTKHLSAGRCSYITNLGEGMKCHSNDNCYADKFVCSKKTKTCTAKPPTDLPYQATCQSKSQCASKACLSGHCGCVASSDCTATEYCSADATCVAKTSYGTPCSSSDTCLDDVCTSSSNRRGLPSFGSTICGCVSDSVCTSTEYCAMSSNLCVAKQPYQGTCTASTMCASGAPCIAGACGCSSSSDCSSSQYCARDTSTCTAKASVGASCSLAEPDGCASNLCLSSGVCGCQVENDCPAPGNVQQICSAEYTCIYTGFCDVTQPRTCLSLVCFNAAKLTGVPVDGPGDLDQNCVCHSDAQCGSDSVCSGSADGFRYCQYPM